MFTYRHDLLTLATQSYVKWVITPRAKEPTTLLFIHSRMAQPLENFIMLTHNFIIWVVITSHAILMMRLRYVYYECACVCLFVCCADWIVCGYCQCKNIYSYPPKMLYKNQKPKPKPKTRKSDQKHGHTYSLASAYLVWLCVVYVCILRWQKQQQKRNVQTLKQKYIHK